MRDRDRLTDNRQFYFHCNNAAYSDHGGRLKMKKMAMRVMHAATQLIKRPTLADVRSTAFHIAHTFDEMLWQNNRGPFYVTPCSRLLLMNAEWGVLWPATAAKMFWRPIKGQITDPSWQWISGVMAGSQSVGMMRDLGSWSVPSFRATYGRRFDDNVSSVHNTPAA